MANISLRHQQVSDAKRFFEILHHPAFKNFGFKPKTIEEEEKFLKQNEEKRRKNTQHNYTILYDDKIIGGCGLWIDTHRPHVGETGIFIDPNHHGKGIATQAIKLLVKKGFEELNLVRISSSMRLDNYAVQKTVERNGFIKEGILKKYYKINGIYTDFYIYAKINPKFE